jgi:hypothetical protein
MCAMPRELIYVDAGNSDSTWRTLCVAAKRRGPQVKPIRLRCDIGQAAAMQAGIDAARDPVADRERADRQGNRIRAERRWLRAQGLPSGRSVYLLADDGRLFDAWRRQAPAAGRRPGNAAGKVVTGCGCHVMRPCRCLTKVFLTPCFCSDYLSFSAPGTSLAHLIIP